MITRNELTQGHFEELLSELQHFEPQHVERNRNGVNFIDVPDSSIDKSLSYGVHVGANGNYFAQYFDSAERLHRITEHELPGDAISFCYPEVREQFSFRILSEHWLKPSNRIKSDIQKITGLKPL